MQDVAKTKIAKFINIEVETRDMHDGIKFGSSAVEELTHRIDGLVTNPFPAGDALLKKLWYQAKNFFKNHTNCVNYNKVLDEHPYLSRFLLKRDTNKKKCVLSCTFIVLASKISKISLYLV